MFYVCSLFAIPGPCSETVVWWRNDPDNLLSTVAGATLSARLLSCLFGLVFFSDGSALLSLLVYMQTERTLKHLSRVCTQACVRMRSLSCGRALERDPPHPPSPPSFSSSPSPFQHEQRRDPPAILTISLTSARDCRMQQKDE